VTDCPGVQRAPHSFPTRRSSDLATDGVDGNSANAGAWVDSNIARRATDVGAFLSAFDTASWCEREGLAFTTGPTGTNVADVQIRSEEHTSELQSRENLVCRLLLE